MTGEWIEHHGKGYPDLPMDTLVQVRFEPWGCPAPLRTVEWWGVNWREDPDMPSGSDITHYRVLKP